MKKILSSYKVPILLSAVCLFSILGVWIFFSYSPLHPTVMKRVPRMQVIGVPPDTPIRLGTGTLTSAICITEIDRIEPEIERGEMVMIGGTSRDITMRIATILALPEDMLSLGAADALMVNGRIAYSTPRDTSIASPERRNSLQNLIGQMKGKVPNGFYLIQNTPRQGVPKTLQFIELIQVDKLRSKIAPEIATKDCKN